MSDRTKCDTIRANMNQYGKPNHKLPKSALEYVLKGLIPYTEANIKLTFKPALFFNDLAKISRAKRPAIKNAYYRAQRQGLVAFDDTGIPRLTLEGQRRAQPFVAAQLGNEAQLMVMFDIPEDVAWKRRRLRSLLHELGFEQVQKSIWRSQYDYREILAAEIKQYDLQAYVLVYEGVQLTY